QREQLTEAAVCRYTQSVRTLDPSDPELEPHAVAADDPLPRPAGRLHQLVKSWLTQSFEHPPYMKTCIWANVAGDDHPVFLLERSALSALLCYFQSIKM